MAAFQRIYSRELETAVQTASLDRGVAPARVIQEDIVAGRFTVDGVTFPAQNVGIDTVRGWIREERQRRAGRVESPLAKLEPRDAIETLRLRLLSSADAMLKHQEEKRRDRRDPERMRQIARLVREAAAIPGHHEPRPPRPGQHVPGEGRSNGGKTEGGLAGAILAAHGRGETAQTPPYPQPTGTETNNAQATKDETNNAQQDNTTPVQTDGGRGVGGSERTMALPT